MFGKKQNVEQNLTEEQRNAPMPYYVHEGAMYLAERTQRRLWIIIIILIVVLLGTNTAWIVYESQFEDIAIEQTGDTDGGGNNYFNGTGELNLYGEGAASD